MTDFEKLRQDAAKLSETKLRERAEADIGFMFPENMSVQEMRSKIAEWFKQYDKIIKNKTSSGFSAEEESEFISAKDIKK